jgi:hypothetical protein
VSELSATFIRICASALILGALAGGCGQSSVPVANDRAARDTRFGWLWLPDASPEPPPPSPPVPLVASWLRLPRL